MKPIQKQFCKHLKLWFDSQSNLSVNLLAEMLNGSQGYISNALNGRRCGDEEWRRKVARKINLPYEYMIGLDELVGTPPKDHTEIIVKAPTPKSKAFLEENTANYRAVPLYESGRLAAWSNGAAFDQYEEATSQVIVYLPELAHHANHKLIAVRVGGDSMEPLIPKDSIVIIDKDDREFADDKIFAVAVDEGSVDVLAVKRVRKAEVFKGFVFWSENSAHSPRVVVESDWLRLCVGRVIWMWRSFGG